MTPQDEDKMRKEAYIKEIVLCGTGLKFTPPNRSEHFFTAGWKAAYSSRQNEIDDLKHKLKGAEAAGRMLMDVIEKMKAKNET